MLGSGMKLKSSILLTAVFAASSAIAQTPANVTDDDRAAIQVLVGQYAQALGGCKATEFADLFAPDGAFVSGFRGRMVGHDRLVMLVESERQCIAPAAAKGGGAPKGGAPRPAPTATLEVTAKGVKGLVNAGAAEYQDEYVKTPQGWRFASRTVVVAAEKAAGLDAPDMLAIDRLSAGKLGDYFEPDQNGVKRLMTSGVRLAVKDGQVTGRAFLKDGSYNDDVYERVAPGNWKLKASTHVAK
jgi:hypothetical protein